MYLFDSCPQVIVRVYSGRHDGSLEQIFASGSWNMSSESPVLSHSYGRYLTITCEVDVECWRSSALETRTWRKYSTSVKAI
jgi:hypothetical protein